MENRGVNINPSEEVAMMISESYEKLYNLCECQSERSYDGRSSDDVFQDTILYVIHDENAPKEKETFIRYFQYKYNMILFRTIRDSLKRKGERYAYNTQAKEKE